MPLVSDVGMLLPMTARPSPSFVAALVDLLGPNDLLSEFAQETHDRRMSIECWRDVLNLELQQLLAWAVRRLSSKPTKLRPPQRNGPIKTVLCLLPGYGIALHLLRRAAPFAGLGLPTFCGMKRRNKSAIRLVELIGRRLAISSALAALPCPCRVANKYLNSKATTVVVTGRTESAQRIEESTDWQQVIGCTGRCCVVVGQDAIATRKLANVIKANQYTPSCARLGEVIVVSNLAPNARVRLRVGDHWKTTRETLDARLQVLHPSIVLTPHKGPNRRKLTMISGYRLYNCDSNGAPDCYAGFGADPLWGWPGDYVI